MATTTARSAGGRVTIRLNDRDIQAILRAFSKMDKQANDDLRDLSKDISLDLVDEFRNAARGTRWYPEQATFVAQSARATRDRVPSVSLGGGRRYGSTESGAFPGSLLFLSEFGRDRARQRRTFRNQAQVRAGTQGGLQGPPRSPKEGRGNRGWWLFPRLKRIQPDILRRWINGAQKVADVWKAV
ncbi:MAG TPA: hypothetical protein VIG24_03825 [Acidimicrobiia bacterium]